LNDFILGACIRQKLQAHFYKIESEEFKMDLKYLDIETVILEGIRKNKENELKTFNVIVNNSKEERKYNDILYVHYWISKKTGRIIYKVYMKNKEVFYLDNDLGFNKSYIPMGINNVERVRLKKYL